MSESSKWSVVFTKYAAKDLKKLREPVLSHVHVALEKVSANPLPITEGGYGKPLGNRRSYDLTGLLKVKLRSDGVRIVYRLERVDREMIVIVIGIRDDDAVYKEAARRI